MTWFKVDDKFGESRKVRSIPRGQRMAVIGLWTIAGQWSAGQLTNGEIPGYMIEELGGNDRLAGALVECGLWHETVSGYVFHDWADWQPTREKVEEDRAAARERMAKRRSGSAEVRANKSEQHQNVREVFATPVPSRPVPTRPEAEKPSSTADAVDGEAAAIKPDFETFWQRYPRRVGKAPAFRAYRSARRKVDADTITNALRTYVVASKRLDPSKIAHPSTWLNREPWHDDPDAIAPATKSDRQSHTDDLFDRAMDRARTRDAENERKAIA